MVMPCLQDVVSILQDKGADAVEFAGGKPMIRAQRDWSQPKLTPHSLAAHMDMRRFLTIKAIEEQAIGAWDIGNRWHASHLEKPEENERRDPQYT
jgi:hypothetical protein